MSGSISVRRRRQDCLSTIGVLVLVLTLPGAVSAQADYGERPEVLAFIDELVASEGFARDELKATLSGAKYQQSIIDAISRPAEKRLTWAQYRRIFIVKRRIEGGVAFMAEHRDVLARAEAKYGVPPEVVAAVIGVETMYGRIMGNYRVLDALATLGFDYPPRSTFFRKQLREFMILAREEQQNPESLKGSYAGAMGYGQFIPSSYRDFAVDFDGDGVRDIWKNTTDAIGSVANYLSVHGWRKGAPVTTVATWTGRDDEIFKRGLKPELTVAELRGKGFYANGRHREGVDPADGERATAMKLEGSAGDEYWIGLHNFYVITRYNHSHMYAMAVFQLSQELRTSSP